MNETIRKLAEQADPEHWHSRWYSGINPRVLDPEIEKLIELIVQECADIMDKDADHPYNSRGSILKYYFGIK